MVVTLLLLTFFLFSDILSKYFTEVYIPLGGNIEVIPNVLNLTLGYNTGMAFSMLDDSTLLLAILSLAASIAIIFLVRQNDWETKKLYSVASTMLLAGTYGNMIDRFLTVFKLRKGVVDMIVFKPLDFISNLITGNDFAVFNIADAWLVVGVILLAIDILFLEERRKKKYGKNNS